MIVERTGDYQVVIERGSRDGLKTIYATIQPPLLPPSRRAPSKGMVGPGVGSASGVSKTP
jgi:hypothetical protein